MSATVDDVLSLLDEMNEQGRVEYADYSQLHDAIAATLGGGECECEGTIEWQWTGPTTYYEHELTCGHVITSVDNEPPKFCEECGAKVRKAARR